MPAALAFGGGGPAKAAPVKLPAAALSGLGAGKARQLVLAAPAAPRGVGAGIAAGVKAYPKVAAQEAQGAAKAKQLIAASPKVTVPKPSAKPGGGLPAAVVSARIGGLGGAIDPIGGFIGHALGDLIKLPVVTAEGIAAPVGAEIKTIKDILAGKGAQEQMMHNSPNEVLARQALSNFEPVKVAETAVNKGPLAGISQLGTDLYQHPILTSQQFMGLGSVPGRVAGAVERSGLASDAAHAAASQVREPTILAPAGETGNPITAIHSTAYSPNRMVQRLQQVAENNPAIQGIRNQVKAFGWPTMHNVIVGASDARRGALSDVKANMADAQRGTPAINAVNKHVDFLHGALSSRLRSSLEGLHDKNGPDGAHMQAAADALGHDKIAQANVGHVLVGDITQHNPDLARAQLVALRDSIASHRDDVAQGLVHSEPDALKQSAITEGNINKLLASPHFEQHLERMFTAAPHLAPVVRTVDNLAHEEGLYSGTQLGRRAVMHYAVRNMDGVRPATAADLSPGALAYRSADKGVALQQRAVQVAQKELARWQGYRGKGPRIPEDRVAHQSAIRAVRAAKDEQRQIAVERTRLNAKGMDLNSPLAKTIYARIDQLQRKTEFANRQALVDKNAADAARSERHAQAMEDLHNAKESLNDQVTMRQTLKRHEGQSYQGLVQPNEAHDPTNPLSAPMRPLPTHEIIQHMADNNVHPDVVYVNEQVPGRTGADSELSQIKDATGAVNKTRHAYTGVTAHTGAWDASLEGVLRSINSSMYRVQRSRNFNDFVHQVATHRDVHPDDVKAIQDQYLADHGVHLTPMYQHGKGLSDDQLAQIAKNQGKEGSSEDYAQKLLDARIMSPDRYPDERVSLVPSAGLQRQREHLAVDGSHNVFGTLNRWFRNAVLPTSPKWLLGNLMEQQARLGLTGHGLGISDHRFANKVLDPSAMGYSAVHDYRAMVGAEGQRNYGRYAHDVAAENPDHPRIQALTKLNPYSYIKKASYAFNRKLESHGEMAVLGRQFKNQIRDFQSHMDTAGKTADEYIQMVRDGITGPQAITKAELSARQINDVLGKYSGYSPKLRAYIKSVAPFLPWYLNSMKYIYHTLPIHHPMAQAALTSMSAAFPQLANPDSKSLAGKFADAEFAGQPFGDLLTAIKTSPDAYWPLNRYLPAGAFTQGGPVGAATQSFAPWLLPPAMALFTGNNPFGKQMRDSHGNPVSGMSTNADLAALQQLVGTFANPAQQLYKIFVGQGRTPRDFGFGFKPNSSQGSPSIINGLTRVLDPFRSTHLRPNSQATIKGGLPGGGGLGLAGGSGLLGGGGGGLPGGK